MEEGNQYSGYKGIFKSTFLFGFVQVFKVIIGIVSNKVAAIFLGAEGMGIMGIFSSTISLVQTGAGLGVSQSAVRDISQANQLKDVAKFSKTIGITHKVIYFTSLFGCIITILLSPWLSEWTMGNRNYTFAYILLSLVVGFQILSEGQLAILKGMRQLQSLAKASMIGSVVGLITGVPLFYFYGKNGIVASLIITSLSALIFSSYYVTRIKYDRLKISPKEVFQEASPMVRMGIALMFITFLWTIVALIISTYIRHKGGFAEVGFYQAGTTILSRYFGVVITALSTDYYPRIAAVNTDNKLLQEELNKQSAVSLVLACPLIVVFLFLLPYLVPLLYSSEFFPTIDFVKYAIFGTLITMVSNQVDMILVAKFQIRIFTVLAVGIRIFQVITTIVLYNYFGLIGLGISLTLMGVAHMILMTTVVYRLYKIKFNAPFLKLAAWVLLFSICALLTNEIIHQVYLKWALGAILSIASFFFALYVSKRNFDIDFIKLLTNKFKMRKL
jgi:O-antigen/teichoic acid export membrane protein